ncbi:ATPase family AAA domain-containing 3-B [Micractinium conductrix]|uniref:ATPase family AAA domain-containing 3-B n=1 Tax=Micractinium conductrix TaxID=554055 RepID=A0A2P6V7Y2_9CHLO|nr:ATPase family AAA domain-containing 3-B [Micractinium conductrix]|eukprot:PSC70197.1 ATPase family AAA domain-containing 3-B [Micractinium conductrix]
MAARLLATLAAGAAAGVSTALCADDKGLGFDPEGLERGAKALREINASPWAKKVFEQIRVQEQTKQAELRAKEAEFKAQAEQAAIQHEKVRWEEQRKSMQQDSQQKAQLAQYQDELARKRMETEHEKNRQRNMELVALQEESGKRAEAEKAAIAAQIEAERRATEKYKAQLDKEVQREKALAEAEGRTQERRQNKDIYREELQIKLEEDRKRLVEAINTTFSNLGSAALGLLTDRDRLLTAVGGLSLLALGVYSAREGTRSAAKAFDRWFGTPKLVRETSRKPLVGRGAAPVEKTVEEVKRDFSDIVLQPGLQDHVRSLAALTANVKRHGAPFRHMLFYGPPGTGKTMAAKRLAKTSGMDYAILSGGDVAPLGGNAVTQLHETFDWAERSRRGLLLLIDEADAFLSRRGGNLSEGSRAAINAFLYRTGEQSRDFCVVLATNRPSDLDPAVIDRTDEAIEFALPGDAERHRILQVYFDQYILKAGTAQGGAGAGAATGVFARLSAFVRGRKSGPETIAVKDVADEDLWWAAEKMQGFSGRELAKFMASVQAMAYGSHNSELTAEMFRRLVDNKVAEHAKRRSFIEAGGGDAPY